MTSVLNWLEVAYIMTMIRSSYALVVWMCNSFQSWLDRVQRVELEILALDSLSSIDYRISLVSFGIIYSIWRHFENVLFPSLFFVVLQLVIQYMDDNGWFMKTNITFQGEPHRQLSPRSQWCNIFRNAGYYGEASKK